MTIARHSAVNPKTGQAPRVEQIFDELLTVYAAAPGYIWGFRYRPQEGPGEVGRITVWRSHDDADHVAQNSHVIALRAELSRIIQGEHIERVLVLEHTTGNPPRS